MTATDSPAAYPPLMRALLSVTDKTGLVDFARALSADFGIQLISTGGTAAVLRRAGLEVRDVSELTGFPEMLDGRVKTLHPAVHGGLLARRDLSDHLATVQAADIDLIDLVVVNLYDFGSTVTRAEVSEAEAIESIDIGGPAMLRSAAKNRDSVTVVFNPADYEVVLSELRAHGGATTGETRRRLAAGVFAHTAAYDAAIASYLTASCGIPPQSTIPPNSATPPQSTIPSNSATPPNSVMPGLTRHPEPCRSHEPLDSQVKPENDLQRFENDQKETSGPIPDQTPAPCSLEQPPQTLRYGENPHQRAAFYRREDAPAHSLARARQLQGKELSYNNILDTDGAWSAVREFDRPAVVIVKHTNPCGAALRDDLAEAYQLAWEGDPISAYGGIIACNRRVPASVIEAIIANKQFVEVFIAPDFTPEALRLLSAKKNLRVLATGGVNPPGGAETLRSVEGGLLVQDEDAVSEDPTTFTTPTKRPPTAAER
ncbi:MAG: bifunctional phosphoribosylaminoimidazolecarboxamide formyltransferase/IMP cyclohydrolase, partial [Actinomycetes bacterium]|nr:bifunctional phosphoribosylaminoimidazolecarboxamide formyltransferase/IMP cyclohydrolase [Actinomycetes bacterium]